MECEKHHDIARRLEEHDVKIEGLREKIAIVEIKTAEQERDIKTVFNELKKIENMILRLLTKVDDLAFRPGKKYDSIMDKVIYFVMLGIFSAAIYYAAK